MPLNLETWKILEFDNLGKKNWKKWEFEKLKKKTGKTWNLNKNLEFLTILICLLVKFQFDIKNLSFDKIFL